MKELKLSFIAQRLDNQDPDHMELEGCELTEEDVDKRQKLDRQVSEVSWDGSQVSWDGSQGFSEEHHAAFLLDDKFLLKTPPKERDEADRISPILCYGRVPPEPSESWPNDVVKELIAFAGRIKRTVPKKSEEVARCAVEAIVKKKRRNSVRRKALWGTAFAVGLAVLWILYWLIFKKHG